MKKANETDRGNAERKAAAAVAQVAANPEEELFRELFGGGTLSSIPKRVRGLPPLKKDDRPPMEYWRKGWVFKNVQDLIWQNITEGAFPDYVHTTHPGYVLQEIGDYGIALCPLTTHPKKKQRKRLIPKGKLLDVTGHVMDKDSYLVERAISRLPRCGQIFKRNPSFLGVYPPEKLQDSGDQHA